MSYKNGNKFWEDQTADNNGVFLGFEFLHEEDIKFSRDVFNRYKHKLPSFNSALDCAAGVGRVT